MQEHYRGIAQREKMEKESRRFLGRKLSYLQLSDKFGLSSVVSRLASGMNELCPIGGAKEDTKVGFETILLSTVICFYSAQ